MTFGASFSPAWLARLALVGALMAVLAPPPRPPLVLGPPQTVRTRSPVLCVHTRLTDEVEPWKILRTLELVRELGASQMVEYFPWAYYAPARGQFDWSHADLRINFAVNQGLTVLARLGGLTPPWVRARPDGAPTVDTLLPREYWDDFGEFVYQFALRYRDRVRHLIIWNEPNLTLEWGFQPVSPEDYTALLRLAYARAKQADPDIVVLGGALAPNVEPPGSDRAMNDLAFLERMYQAGAGEVMDGLAVHAYGLSYAPDEPPAPEVLNFRRVELWRDLMTRYGYAHQPMYLTESGWNDSPRWTRAVKPATRIDYTLRGYEWAEQYWPYMRAVCTWAFRYPAPQRTYGDYFTLVAPDFTLKPIYLAIQEWARP